MINVQEELRKRGFSLLRLDSKTVIVDSIYFSGPIVFCESRNDGDDDGRWITTKNGHHIHLNEEGEPDKGNPRVIQAMNQRKGTGQSSQDRVTSSSVGNQKKIEVNGPRQTKEFIKRYVADNPEILKEAIKYRGVLEKVKSFDQTEPGSYSVTTGERIDFTEGYSVTFHQNYKVGDEFGAYDDETYSVMCAIAKHELKSPDVWIGFYENPEVSFNCPSKKIAKDFAIKHNQREVWDCKNGKGLKNKYYNPDTNPFGEKK